MKRRLRKKLCKRKFPPLDPTKRLDWKDKELFAFMAKSNFEAAYFFERLVDHTMATEAHEERDDAAFAVLGRLRMVASNNLGNANVDHEYVMGFVYTRYIRPMCKRYGIKLDKSEYDLHAKKQLIYVPDMSAIGR